MTSNLEQSIRAVQVNNYVALATITAVGYDYILTFSSEIEYIWVGLGFLVVPIVCSNMISEEALGIGFYSIRYCSLFRVVLFHILCPLFELLSSWPCKGEITVLLYWWNCWIFVCAADLVMILRVWALYSQSRLVLVALLGLFIVEVATLLARFLVESISDFGSHFTVSIAQVHDFSVCIGPDVLPIAWLVDSPYVAATTLGALMCFLTAIRFTKELLRMYKTSRHLRLNRYMQCLARDAIIYFVVVLLFAVFMLLADLGSLTASGWPILMAVAIQQIPPVTLIPRFILTLREIYAHETRTGNGDAAFGFGSEFEPDGGVSTIRFVDVGRDEGEEIEMEEWIQDGGGAHVTETL